MSIYQKLYDWQKTIIDKFSDRKSFGLFLDMGLGKTPISLAFAENHNVDKILVITINSKAEETKEMSGSWLNWANQMSKAYEPLNKHSAVEDIKNDTPQILLINYESTHKQTLNKKGEKERMLNLLIYQFILSCKNKNVALILDESHKVKNLSSVQTKMISKIKTLLNLKSNNLYTYLLSGTPFTQGYIDLYAQLKLLDYPGTKTSFIDQYCERGQIPGLLGWQQPIIGYKNIKMLYDTIHKYALTIMSTDVINLPEQIFQYHTLPQTFDFSMFNYPRVTRETLDKYFKVRKINPSDVDIDFNGEKNINNPFHRNAMFPSTDMFAETTGTFYLRARQISIGFQGNAENGVWLNTSRLVEIKQFMKDNRDNYVIFYNYTPELYELFTICEELKYDIDVYCGELKSTHFYDKYEAAPEDKRVNLSNRVILANFSSGSTGKNWQLYNHCIITSLPVYKDWAQGIKRIHRIGSTKTTFYHIFHQDNWLDKKMLEALQNNTDYNNDMFEADYNKTKLFAYDAKEN